MSRDPGPFNIRPTQSSDTTDTVVVALMWFAFTAVLACLAMAAGYFFGV
jgi:hypothetical protein